MGSDDGPDDRAREAGAGAHPTVREATPDDYDDVAAMTSDTWPDRGGGDYIADIYHDWIDREGTRTFVAEAADGPAAGDVVGITQVAALSPWEDWYQGMRVHLDYRGQGVSAALNAACFDWSRSRGATVARLMVFSWNAPALGAARANGFEPTTEFRWMHPEPDAGAELRGVLSDDPDAAYAHWAASDARAHLRGLALDRGESWACSELTRSDLHAAGDGDAVIAVLGSGNDGGVEGAVGGVRAMTVRTRDYERPDDDGEPVRWAEYGAAAWDDVAALDDLVAAIARDAASVGADRTRVLVPETVAHVSDAALVGAGISDEPDFVLSADLAVAGE